MEVQSHRACAHCRSLKTRCLVDETNPGVCERCARFGRLCVFTPLQKRRPRKRTDTRVTELEQEMTVLRAMLTPESTNSIAMNSTASLLPSQTWSAELTTDHDAIVSGVHITPRQLSASQAAWGTFGKNTAPARPEQAETLYRGLVSISTARKLVEQYKNEMYPHYPIVYIPPQCTAEELRQAKPMLFLAIIAGAAGKEYPELAIKLDQVVLEEYANRTVLGSEKSLELVQCLLVSSSWYQPHSRLNQYKYSEYIHMAGMMAIDIGIGSRPLEEGARADDGTASTESRRTFLSVLLKSAGTTITSRKPATMRMNSYTHECLRYFEEYPQALPGDRMLTYWIRLLIIADEIGSAFSYDDPGAVASILDSKTPLMIAAFKKRLSDWHCGCAEFDSFPTLQMTYYTVRLYLCEVVLHVDHRPEDFKVPYRMSPIFCNSDAILPVKASVEALAELVENSHSLLRSFLSINVGIARALPLGLFVRVSYAAFILAKLCTSAAHQQSQLSPLIDQSNLDAELYMNQTLLHIRSAIGVNGCRLPAIFLNLLSQMREWCIRPEIDSIKDGNSQMNRAIIHALPQEKDISTTSIEDTASPSTSPETSSSRTARMTPALTGTFEDNYEIFGNDKAVASAAFHGRLSQTVELRETLAEVEAALSGEISQNDVSSRVHMDNMQAFETTEVGSIALSNENDEQFHGRLSEIWNDDNAFSVMDGIGGFLDEEMLELNNGDII